MLLLVNDIGANELALFNSYPNTDGLDGEDETRVSIKGDTGNFGIGTVSPLAPLHVVGNGGDVTTLLLDHPGEFLPVGVENRLDFGQFQFVSARIAAFNDSAQNFFGLKFYTNSDNETEEPNAEPAMTLLGNNNVGIGTTLPAARLDVVGPIIRQVARATGLGPIEDIDQGQITSRVLSFDKALDSTALRIVYTDNLRALNNNTGCRWELRVDGAPCPGGELVFDYLVWQGENPARSRAVVGFCEGVSGGPRSIEVWVGEIPGYGGSDCQTGFLDSRWTLEVEEVY